MAMAIRLFADNIPRLILCALLIFIWSIDYKTQGDFTLCLVKNITGKNCPGCGVLRGISAVMHLDLKSAYDLNNMNIVVIPLLTYLFTRYWMSNRFS
jgi:Protein of unknown function (DUF2752)